MKTLRLVLILLLIAAPARANNFPAPTWPLLLEALVRFNALNLADDPLVDEYTIVTECDLYQGFYADDFKWKQVRDAVRDSAEKNKATFPTSFGYLIKLQLGRYDFVEKIFRFTDKTAVKSINTLSILKVDGANCGSARVKYLPQFFRAVLAAPVYIPGIPMAQTDAKALLAVMKIDNNPNRIIYARFNFNIISIDPLRRNYTSSGAVFYNQTDHLVGDPLRINARLDSVDFYEDPKMTRLIYKYTP